LYVGGVIAAGMTLLVVSIGSLVTTPPDLRWLLLVALSVGSAHLMLRMPEVPVSFSISDIFTFAAALMFGPAAGTLAAAIDAGVMATRLVRSRPTATRYLFNVSAVSLAMWLAAHSFFLISGTAPLAADPSIIISRVGSLAVFALLYFVLNTGLIAAAIALATRVAVVRVWRMHFWPLWPGYAGGAAAAGLGLFLISISHGDLRALTFVLPIPFIVYIAFRTAVARMQDDVAHLTRVNAMYLSTIEALAQAVDARDEVTHDHIRRVQKNAMRLARQLNIEEELELRALEAAALLHDTGKLAIPEHILNKPDRLTPAEFETMKDHANIGADILSSIEFPFPVVPIVRHHHENWDGSGYPHGLRGNQIPIGARILSVVDCFDALTSDRPYRRALPVDQALDIIVARRGLMYDPAVVDAMLQIRHEIVAEGGAAGAPVVAKGTDFHAQRPMPAAAPSDPGGTTATLHIAGRIGEAIEGHRDLTSVCAALHQQLSAVMPGLTLVLYEHNPQLDVLRSRAAAGLHRDALANLAIKTGSRLTGWVAAHRKPIANSQAALDLGSDFRDLDPPPQLCASAPIAAGERLVGVLTCYSIAERPFGADAVALLEVAAALLGPALAGRAASMRERVPAEVGARARRRHVSPRMRVAGEADRRRRREGCRQPGAGAGVSGR
jgi:putative nucleotidyltransferase with HDIG domain